MSSDLNLPTNNNEQPIIQDDNASSLYTGMNEVFAQTKSYIDTMKQGDKIGIRDLTDKVAAQVSMPASKVMTLVQLFCKRSKEVSVEVGRSGGVFKGGKPQRLDARKRCETCHQVIRAPKEKASTPDLSELLDECEDDAPPSSSEIAI